MNYLLGILRAWQYDRKQNKCEHFWRPAISRPSTFVTNDGSLAVVHHGGCWKVCDYCEKAERLDLPGFYAQFGRMPW